MGGTSIAKFKTPVGKQDNKSEVPSADIDVIKTITPIATLVPVTKTPETGPNLGPQTAVAVPNPDTQKEPVSISMQFGQNDQIASSHL
jgi:hypothetical protein